MMMAMQTRGLGLAFLGAALTSVILSGTFLAGIPAVILSVVAYFAIRIVHYHFFENWL